MRPSPTESATLYKIGTRKYGNDGNTYIVTMTKAKVKRWTELVKTIKHIKKRTRRDKKIVNKTRKRHKVPNTNTDSSIWGKNKKLENFWRKLASGDKVILVYNNGKIVHHATPKTQPAKQKKYIELENNKDIKAIITSAMSSDTYEALYKRVKDKKPDEIIKNYRKYLTNYGKGDKSWYL